MPSLTNLPVELTSFVGPGKRLPSHLQQRGFLYAMSALKEYLRFHAVQWPRAGESLVLGP